MTKEPPIVIEDREELIFMLSEAATLEHMVMCEYLFATFSLKREVSEGVTAEQLAAIKRWERTVSLVARQEMLHRPQATRAALIPIRKTAAWWDLAQDERRAIFEEQSRHIGIGMEYLPAVARRLHHSRELGEPFDFLTWFEYAPRTRECL